MKFYFFFFFNSCKQSICIASLNIQKLGMEIHFLCVKMNMPLISIFPWIFGSTLYLGLANLKRLFFSYIFFMFVFSEFPAPGLCANGICVTFIPNQKNHHPKSMGASCNWVNSQTKCLKDFMQCLVYLNKWCCPLSSRLITWKQRLSPFWWKRIQLSDQCDTCVIRKPKYFCLRDRLPFCDFHCHRE